MLSGDSRLIAPSFPLFRALCAALAAAAEHRAHLLCRGQVQARPCLRYSWIFTGIWDKGKARNRNKITPQSTDEMQQGQVFE